jgi:hypothetical protein
MLWLGPINIKYDVDIVHYIANEADDNDAQCLVSFMLSLTKSKQPVRGNNVFGGSYVLDECNHSVFLKHEGNGRYCLRNIRPHGKKWVK